MKNHRRESVSLAGRVRALALATLVTSAAPGQGAGGSGRVPEPAAGQSAPTTLALLHYNRDRCDQIAGDVLAFWSRNSRGGEQAARDHVLHASVADLAAARAAGDLARRFLLRAKEESNLETGSSLERLARLQTELCDLVALPTAPYATFEAAVRGLGERIEREEAELGRLLVVPEDALRRALDPYLVPIQLAGVAAEGELIDYLNSLKKEPEPPTLAELMTAWYQVYSPGVQSVKTALGKVLGARRTSDRAQLSSGCRELSGAVVVVLDHPRLLRAPDERLNEPLRRAYQQMQRLAGHCTAGNFKEFDRSMREMQQELQTAAAVLGKYSLRP